MEEFFRPKPISIKALQAAAEGRKRKREKAAEREKLLEDQRERTKRFRSLKINKPLYECAEPTTLEEFNILGTDNETARDKLLEFLRDFGPKQKMRAVLLCGRSGVGKTLMARLCLEECGFTVTTTQDEKTDFMGPLKTVDLALSPARKLGAPKG